MHCEKVHVEVFWVLKTMGTTLRGLGSQNMVSFGGRYGIWVLGDLEGGTLGKQEGRILGEDRTWGMDCGR